MLIFHGLSYLTVVVIFLLGNTRGKSVLLVDGSFFFRFLWCVFEVSLVRLIKLVVFFEGLYFLDVLYVAVL